MSWQMNAINNRLMQLMRFMPLPENADKTENVKHEKNKEA
jgi:hypothetical protein